MKLIKNLNKSVKNIDTIEKVKPVLISQVHFSIVLNAETRLLTYPSQNIEWSFVRENLDDSQYCT
jgi:hypothetical protein